MNNNSKHSARLLSTSVLLPFLLSSTLFAQPEVQVAKIWDQAPHNAFTDLIRFKGEWFCVFREGKAHVSPDGALRVIASKDGAHWKSAALITSTNGDLRDAKIAQTADGELMLSGAIALPQPTKAKHLSLAWFSRDGRSWGEPVVIGDTNYWLWRTIWHKDVAYSIGYGTASARTVRLYSSRDGRRFETLVPTLFEEGFPNESSLIFDDNDVAYCLLRRDGKPASGKVGIAKPPYTAWEWKDAGAKIGGPHWLRVPDGRLIGVVRLYDQAVRTSIVQIDSGTGRLTELRKLPSGGDTSYAGLVWHENKLWVSYYSSHEGKASIYLAKVVL